MVKTKMIPTSFLYQAMRVASIGVLLAVSSGCGVNVTGWSGEQIDRGYVLDERSFGQIKPGSSAEQVLVTMGSPSTTSTVGGDAWYYISQKLYRPASFMKPEITDQRVLAVYFDKSKKVTRIANYGLQDGRVFDFVTRTTPTAGNETSFVKNMLVNLLRFS